MSLVWVLLQKQGNGEVQQVQLPSNPDALQGLNLSVSYINNQSQFMYVSLRDPEDIKGCNARLFLQRCLYNSSIYPFEYEVIEEDNVTFFNCSSAWSIYGSRSCPILAFGSQESVLSENHNLTSCTMISRLHSLIPAEYLQNNEFHLKWMFQPKVESHKTRIILSSTGSIVLLLLLVVCFYICRYFKHKGEDQVRLETFLKDYQALKPTRFSYAGIKRITHKFKDKLGEGAHGTVFKAKGTPGYIAPEVFSRNFGNVSYKSDIYSYGMLLLEMVGGRKNIDTNQVLYPEWIHNLIERGEAVSIYIEDEVDIRIAKKLAIVGLWCIQWHSVNRPSMKTVIQMLEGEVDKLEVPPTPFDFTTSTVTPTRHLNLELDVIHELE
ncbi:hypothetical protein QN277_018681 [Acacia crassicarpa]|uniref:Protein kinase domain-containing protein n=1 Tax=Acacia crassicarpa TaxID=499986 RepID=A0AAE1MSV2_9FABA|nr:hypothetical protein QN277_018681 [Acacia crassicarpa]